MKIFYYYKMKSLKQTIDKLSNENYQNASHPRFSKEIDKSYSKGYTKGFTWIDEVCNYYFNLDKALIIELKMHLQQKLDDTQALKESTYKQGLQESLKNALASLEGDLASRTE